jgi:hypothetical protein
MFANMLDMTAPYVRAILSISPKIGPFMVLFSIFTFGFGDAFKVISLSNEKAKDWELGGSFFETAKRAYLIALGEFQLDEMKTEIAPIWMELIFIICSLMCMVVLMNLFIAIVSNAFEIINS